MIQIRPVSDLRNKFPEIETLVNERQARISNEKWIWGNVMEVRRFLYGARDTERYL